MKSLIDRFLIFDQVTKVSYCFSYRKKGVIRGQTILVWLFIVERSIVNISGGRTMAKIIVTDKMAANGIEYLK